MKCKKYYFTDWDEDDRLGSVMVHCVDKKTYEYWINVLDTSAFEADVVDNKIERLYLRDSNELECIHENIILPTSNLNPHTLFLLEKSKDGNHYIGGQKPEKMNLPVCNHFKTPFQYIGMIDGKDENFRWIGIDEIHILFPIYECLTGVTFDYSDPYNPKVIDFQDHSDAWYDSTGDVGHIITKKVKLKVNNQLPKTFEENEEREPYLMGGIPLWYQGINRLPRCPYTGEVLQFVCELQSFRENVILNFDDVFDKKEYRNDRMHIDALMLFINPNNRVVHITRILV